MLKGQVAGLETVDGCTELLEPGYIGIGQKSPGVGCQPKHELRPSSNRLLIDRSQFLQALHRRLIVRMPEPVQIAQRGIRFYGAPAQIAVAVDDVPILIVDAS